MKVLLFSLATRICFPADLLPLIVEDNVNSRGGNCFSLHFTCRARGWRCIPFWVTHTSTELSTEGQIPRINSSLAWTNAKKKKALFPSYNGPALAQPDQRYLDIVQSLHLEVFQDPSEQSPVQPILTSELTMLEAEGSTRDFQTSHGTYVFLWIYYLGPALLMCLSWPWSWNWRKEGKWHQITSREISSDSKTS